MVAGCFLYCYDRTVQFLVYDEGVFRGCLFFFCVWLWWGFFVNCTCYFCLYFYFFYRISTCKTVKCASLFRPTGSLFFTSLRNGARFSLYSAFLSYFLFFFSLYSRLSQSWINCVGTLKYRTKLNLLLFLRLSSSPTSPPPISPISLFSHVLKIKS